MPLRAETGRTRHGNRASQRIVDRSSEKLLGRKQTTRDFAPPPPEKHHPPPFTPGWQCFIHSDGRHTFIRPISRDAGEWLPPNHHPRGSSSADKRGDRQRRRISLAAIHVVLSASMPALRVLVCGGGWCKSRLHFSTSRERPLDNGFPFPSCDPRQFHPPVATPAD